MKAIFTFLFISICSIAFSQSTATQTITIAKENLEKTKSLKELFPAIPTDCNIVVTEYMFESNGKINSATSKGNSTQTLIKELPLKKGKKVYLTMKIKKANNEIHLFEGVINIE